MPDYGRAALSKILDLFKIVPVHISQFKGKGNAFYRNSSNGKWYEDSNYTILSNDDTQAFKDAIQYLKGFVNVVASTTFPAIELGAGSFLVTSNIVIDGIQNVRIVGNGQQTTRINVKASAGSLFQLGTYNANTTTYFPDTAQGFQLENVHLYCQEEQPKQYNGIRTVTAIQDNGNGNVFLRNVKIEGFKYGFYGAYGSDFTSIVDCRILRNDVGVYLGAGSQQISMHRCEFDLNNEAVVMERSDCGSMNDCQFIDSYVADIVVEANTSLRSGVSTSLIGTDNDMNWEVRNCWFETGAGYNSNSDHQYHIITKGNVSNTYPRGLRVINPTLVSGVNGMGAKDSSKKYSFWRVETGTQFAIENLQIEGARIDCVVDIAAGIEPIFLQKNTITQEGYTQVPYWNNPSKDSVYVNHAGNSFQMKYGSSFVEMTDTQNNKTVRINNNGDNTVSLKLYDGNQWIDRVKISLTNGRVWMSSAGNSISFAGSMPASGDYARGDIVYNNGSDNTILLWKRLTTGSAHVLGTDWKVLNI